MHSDRSIAHKGLVVNRTDKKTVIQLLQPEQCHSCHIKGFCGVSDDDRFRFEVEEQDLDIGDTVSVEVSANSGYKATFWGYLFPFLLIISVLTTLLALGVSEAWAGLSALLVLLPYYAILATCKGIFKRSLPLEIHKL